MQDKQFRNKIHWFTFVFSILVIWVHSYNSELFMGRSDLSDTIYRIEHFFGETVAQVAVPGFFMISAYLFYRNFSWDILWKKWNSRIRSILVPYIVWNFIYYMGYVIASRVYLLQDVVGKGVIPFNLSAAAEAVLHYKYNYVFWYLYQLILLIMIAPVIYALLKKRYVAVIYFLVMLWGIHAGFALPHLNLDALLYYSVAAWFAIHGKKAAEAPWSERRGILGGLVLAASMLLYASYVQLGSVLLQVCFRLSVPVGLWLLIDEVKISEVKPWMKNNFFLYAVHFALVRLMNKTMALVFPGVAAVTLALYFAMPFVLVFISYGLAVCLRNTSKTAWQLLTGSREY